LPFDRGSLQQSGRSGGGSYGRSSVRFDWSNGARLNLLHIHCTCVNSRSKDRKAALTTQTQHTCVQAVEVNRLVPAQDVTKMQSGRTARTAPGRSCPSRR
jgi:hypothetical protein